MSQTVLDSIALGYQPVWNRARQLAAVRLRVETPQPDALDGAHLMQLLGSDWPAAAPVLILSVADQRLLCQALECAPVNNTWLEVPEALFRDPDTLAQLGEATRRGHVLLRHGLWADLRDEVVAPLDVRSLVQLSPGDALELMARRQEVPGPLWPGLLLQGVCDRQLAAHSLDEAGAWGLLGWPDDDVLHAHRHQPLAIDAGVIGQILQAIEDETSLEHLERLVRQDPVLVYRLLLLVNSAAYGLRREIDSLRHALMMIGFTALARWLHEQLPGSESEPDLHPVRYAMVMRSRLAQHLLESGSEDNLRAEVYTTALFAQLDRFMQQPLAELLKKLPMSARVFDAVLRQDGPYHALLDLARVQGDPDALARLPAVCEDHGISLEHANRALIRMLATSRDHAGKRSMRGL
jgi:c-di-GMP phosphodiesterase